MPAPPELDPERRRASDSSGLSAADRIELRALADRYAAAVDARALEALQACFLPDGLLRMQSSSSESSEYRGRSALAEMFELLRPLTLTMHDVTTWALVDDGPQPRAIVHCCAHHLTTRDGEVSDWVMHIRYDDTCARDRQRVWCLRERVATVLFTERRSVRVP